MKDSQIYQRMSNPSVVKTYFYMIRNYDLDYVHEMYDRLISEADDHPMFPALKEAYERRVAEAQI